jgi:multimeric flavodoxin WrbA
MPLTAMALNCSLKGREGEQSSTDKMIGLLVTALGNHGVGFSETIRIVDHDVKEGVTSDEGEGDVWPDIRRRILEADILIFGTPVWLGQMSSVAKRVLERMDAFLSETDEPDAELRQGRRRRHRRQRGRRPRHQRRPLPGPERHRLDDSRGGGLLLGGRGDGQDGLQGPAGDS